ncbi:hypothetical protein IAI10_04470 [Clostridium sp. 19966]|uniref:hypothetical protein n=1 Tax=Clostridium sp. 19966 TaxID=2768166 RepID=UPI0028DF7616|nr:hypothetical protein [Clostridium sp. 19966]MDT8715900.1 hypothetical protein [Clostridium sp. 19966]
MVEIRKKALKRFILFSVVILSVKIINNWYATTTINWTYLKYNNKLYVLCEPGNAAIVNEAKPTLKKIGEVEREIPIFFTPTHNKVSNGLPKGTEVYTSENWEIIIKFKGMLYPLQDTTQKDTNWGNGIYYFI